MLAFRTEGHYTLLCLDMESADAHDMYGALHIPSEPLEK